ncbi:hypothetical protein CD149_07000 [Staphylococcus condimenti]|uniref:4-hydroxythreonine-4-phosphate dehydrogenase n=1 Tax=Staphylococcus condimenti TaxID=70255 RepID=A0AB37GYS8_9STAP|nr:MULTISPECIES: hypothetical protein [Staphylococcus]AMY06803.1 hypothetical protein A4G25_08440 [Staphylococcus condimenti]APR62043.1 hypothetical protein BTZ13_00720 [Staphylococcus condimenti]MDK8644943.1 hypothetical protein [Staphylococcus condimenti]OFP03013.1 hypothetical protein HMPREF3007_08320 [Staphylococcus sp. HMSC065E08]PNZ60598.1 hypothetical protein CD149_07000 [Staphylococcus condimenti]
MGKSELIVMLTHNDYTVHNAREIFEECKDSKAKYWGFKDKGISIEQMKELFAYMKAHGKTTFLEIVEYTEKESLAGAKLALECGCDILMGTKFFHSVNKFCIDNNLKYMPFAGEIVDRPSILKGNIEDIVNEAKEYSAQGVFGFDLLGYRYVGDPVHLINEFVTQLELPVCVAGSLDSYEKLDVIKRISPWAITVGSAFFDNKFEGTFSEQIDKVYDYIN